MPRFIILSTITALFLFGCDGPRQTVDDATPGTTTAQPENYEGKWVLKSLEGKDAVAGTTLIFEGDEISGSGGCNGYSSPYTWKRGKLKIKGVGYTEMACDILQQEVAYFDVLDRVTSGKVEGAVLTLVGSKGELVFERAKSVVVVPQGVLESGTWMLDTIMDEEVASTPIAGSLVSIAFVDGKVSGSLGCNTASGQYTATSGGGLAILDLSTTELSCADDKLGAMSQESVLVGKLNSVTGYSFDKEFLVLEAGTEPVLRFKLKAQ